MNIIFYNRNFSGQIPVKLEIEVDRYSWSDVGGPEKATFKVKSTADRRELKKLLRCPVEIYGTDGGLVWWGYVNSVRWPKGVKSKGLGLDNLYNSIKVQYKKGTTAAGTSAQSIAEYGTKEFFFNLPNATRTVARNKRDTFLTQHQDPPTEMDLSGGAKELTIECYGWWKTLGWKYYRNNTDTNVDYLTQVRTIINAKGQFINGVILEGISTAGISCSQKRDGQNTALNYVTELLNAGTSNGKPMLAYVDKDRYVHIYEQPTKSAQYIIRDDGRLETLTGQFIEDEKCINAVWIADKNEFPISGEDDLFFIERAECVQQNLVFGNPQKHRVFETHYDIAQAYSQMRLYQYMVNLVHNGSTYSGGYDTSPLAPPTGGTNNLPTADLKQAIILSPSAGLIYSSNLDADATEIHWELINGGMSSGEWGIIEYIFRTPSGALYAVGGAFSDRANLFLKRAPAIGENFVTIWNTATADDYFGITGTPTSNRLDCIGWNPYLPEEVFFRAGNSNGSAFFRVNGLDVVELTNLSSATGSDYEPATFGDNYFLAGGNVINSILVNLDYSGYSNPAGGSALSHVRAGVSGTVVVALSSSTLRVSLDNLATYVDITGLTGLDYGADADYFIYKMAIDNSGAQILTRNHGGDKTRVSLDGGNTWSDVAGLPGGAYYVYAFAGGESLDTRWLTVARSGIAGGAKVYYNNQATDGDWTDVSGDILAVDSAFGYAKCLLPIPEDDAAIIPLDTVTQDQVVNDFTSGYTVNTAVTNAITQTITNGDTTHSPSGDAVYDALATKQPLDSDLTAIAGLSPANDDFIQRKAGAWVNRTLAQVVTDLRTILDSVYSTGGAVWGSITGTLSSQTDLQTALDAKLDDSQLDTDGTLAANSDTKIASQKATKTYADSVSSNASVIAKVLTGFSAGAGTVSATDSILQAFQKVVGNISLKLTANSPITGATKTKITYDANGLVTAGADATTADIADSTNKRYVTDANLTVIGNTSGTNTGDSASAPANSMLFGEGVDGDVTISGPTTLTRDMHYNNLTISSSGVLNPGGFVIRVKGTLTIDSGRSIDASGGDGSAGGTGTGGGGSGGVSAYSSGASLPSGMSAPNGEGTSANNTTNGAQSVAPLSILDPFYAPFVMQAGGAGGGGGAHGTSDGGRSAVTQHNCGAKGGNGGAATGSGTSSRRGGGGGAGGGCILIYAYIINNAGTIKANGGAGGSGVTSTDKSGNGGGGGGGTVVVYYHATTGSGLGTLTANGGAAGTGGNGGGAGSNGTPTSYQV